MREILRNLEEAKGEVSPDLQAAAELQAVLMQFDISLSKVWARFEGTGPEMRKAFSGLQGSISALKAATSALQRERRGSSSTATVGGGKSTAANDADLQKRLEGANINWRNDLLHMRAVGEYLYAGEVPKDLGKVQMVYVPKKVKASYAGEYTFSREGTNTETGQAAREFHLLGKGDAVRIWVREDGKITWD